MQLMAPLERRTWQLMHCLERRQSQSVDMTVDMGTAIAHWAYDFMVRIHLHLFRVQYLNRHHRMIWSTVGARNMCVYLSMSSWYASSHLVPAEYDGERRPQRIYQHWKEGPCDA